MSASQEKQLARSKMAIYTETNQYKRVVFLEKSVGAVCNSGQGGDRLLLNNDVTKSIMSELKRSCDQMLKTIKEIGQKN